MKIIQALALAEDGRREKVSFPKVPPSLANVKELNLSPFQSPLDPNHSPSYSDVSIALCIDIDFLPIKTQGTNIVPAKNQAGNPCIS